MILICEATERCLALGSAFCVGCRRSSGERSVSARGCAASSVSPRINHTVANQQVAHLRDFRSTIEIETSEVVPREGCFAVQQIIRVGDLDLEWLPLVARTPECPESVPIHALHIQPCFAIDFVDFDGCHGGAIAELELQADVAPQHPGAGVGIGAYILAAIKLVE